MFKGPGKIVRDNKSSSYPVFELTGVNCISTSLFFGDKFSCLRCFMIESRIIITFFFGKFFLN